MLGLFLRSDVAVAMGTRAVQGSTMALAGLLVITRTTPVDQGFFFTFISLAILLQLCDFGLSYASLQAASHLLAIGRIVELGALTARALRINSLTTIGATFAVGVLGFAMFGKAPVPTGEWLPPWAAFVVGVGANHLLAPWTFLVEGGVSVIRAWRFRLVQETVAGLTLLLVIASGLGLWSLVAYYWVRCLMALVWTKRATIADHFAASERLSMEQWLSESWPFQWRVGVGAISSFLLFQAIGPILFAVDGPSQAGRFSLSLSVMNAVLMITTAWPVSRAAHFGVMLGRHDVDRMLRLWARMVVHSTLFAVLGAAFAVMGFVLLQREAPSMALRFADATTTVLLIATVIAHHLVACIAVVVRAERRDPLLALSIGGAFVTVAMMTVAARVATLDVVALVYFVSTSTLVPFAYVIYRRFAHRQRADAIRLASGTAHRA